MVRLSPPILGLAIGQTLIWAALYYSFPALVTDFETSLGLSRTRLMLTFSLTLLAMGAASPAAGWLIDKGHGPVLLPACTAIGGVLLILLSITTSPLVFQILWVLIGLTLAGALYEATFSLITRVRGTQARPDVTAITLIAGFAGTVSFPASAWLADMGGWQFALRVFGLICVLFCAPLVAWASRALGPGAPDAALPAGSSPVHRNPVFWALSLVFFLFSLHTSAIISHILPLLADRGVPPALAVLTASCIGPMQVAGRFAMMTLGRNIAVPALARLAFTAILAAIPALVFAGLGLPVLALFVLLHGAGIGVISILRPLLIREMLGGHGYGRIAGSIGAFAALGMAVAPATGAALYSLGDYTLMLITLSLGMVTALAILILLSRTTRPLP